VSSSDVQSLVDRYAGLSDRYVSAQGTRIECPDLLNVEFSKQALEKRNGFKRLNTVQLRDCSIRLDGVNDWVRIPDGTADVYALSNKLSVSVDCVLRKFPSAEVTVVAKGYGTDANLVFRISYDPSINTNNGGWRFRAFDGVSTAKVEVSDGSGSDGKDPIDAYRHLQISFQTGSTYDVKVTDAAGATVGATGELVLTTPGTSTNPISVGVMLDSAAAPTGAYFDGNIAELRMWDTATDPAAADVVLRELDNGPEATEYTNLIGYWKFNDGNGSTIADSSTTANNGVIVNQGPTWVTDGTGVIGSSGLQFYGSTGHAHINPDGTNANLIFTDDTFGKRRWTVGVLYTPKMDATESTVRDQRIVWIGSTHATTPSPVGISVSSNAFKFVYSDNSAAETNITLGTVSDYADTRVRLLVGLTHVSGVAETLRAFVIPEGGTVLTGTTSVVNVGDPSSVSASQWFLGAHPTSATDPFTPMDDQAYGIVDDFYILRDTRDAFGTHPLYGPYGFTPEHWFGELSQSWLDPNTEISVHFKCDEGSGNVLANSGVRAAVGSLHPMADDGARWGIGLVEPYDPPEITYLGDYSRIGPKGDTIRSIVAISGTTLYEINPSTGVATAKVGDLHKGGQWTSTQYDKFLYLACKNGRRPRRYDGSTLDWVGLEPPASATVVTTDTSGTLANGYYAVYVTFVDPLTGDESNPSPVVEVDLSGGSADGAFTAFVLPVSPDPQVQRRRVWTTPVQATSGLAAGTTAYLVHTENNNSAVSVTLATTYKTVDITAATMEYTDNKEAPVGSVVKVWKDRLWVGGDPENPTYAWYSGAGTPTRFGTTNFLQTTKDSGDPILAIEPLSDSLMVYLQDNRKLVRATGDTTDPFIMFDVDDYQSAVGPNAVAKWDGRHVFVAERDIVVSTGQADQSLSSPASFTFPSVQTTIVDTVEPTRRDKISAAINYARRQLWVTYTSLSGTFNDYVLVYNFDQGVWSKYRMDMERLASVDDTNDDPKLYGASRGYVVELDKGYMDGYGDDLTSSDLTGTAAATSNTTQVTLANSGDSLAANKYKGLYLHWYDNSANVVRSARIKKNTAGNGSVVTFYAAVTSIEATADTYWIGGMQFFADFLVDFGEVLTHKRLAFLEMGGLTTKNATAESRIRASLKSNDLDRTVSYTTSNTHKDIEWTTTLAFTRLFVGSIGRSFRLRLSDTGLASATSDGAVPNLNGKIRIDQFRLVGERVGAR